MQVPNTQDNNAKIAALRTISATKWVGNTTHDTMDKAFTAINLYSTNSGWYKPTPIRVPTLTGWYMLNEDGSLLTDQRVIKEADNVFKIEILTNAGYDEFEKAYSEIFNRLSK